MSRIHIVLIGTACFALGLGVQALYDVDDVAGFLKDHLGRIFFIALIALVMLAILLFVFYRWAIGLARKRIGAADDIDAPDIVAGLWDSLISTDGVTNPTPEDQRRAAFVSLGAWFLRRQIRVFYYTITVAVLGGLIGSATLFLLYEQNRKLDIQNRQITLQTNAAIVQSIMLEATRRTTLSISNQTLLSDIARAPGDTGRTCQENGPKTSCWEIVGNTRFFHLPANLQARVQTLAKRSTPYYLAEPRDSGGQLAFDSPLSKQFRFRAQSPERGQLIETLVTNQVMIPGTDYNFAALYNADLSNAVLRNLDLNVSDFRDVDLTNADLSESGLQEASFERASLENANLTNANLAGAFIDLNAFQSTNVSGAQFTGAFAVAGFEGDAWAWRGQAPKNLPEKINLTYCTFDPAKHDRSRRPNDC